MKGYEQFFKGVAGVIEAINQTQGEAIEKGAAIVANAIQNDGILHVFGTGHANLVAEDISMRANTLGPINHVSDVSLSGTVNSFRSVFLERVEGIGGHIFETVRPHPQDVFLVISNSGRNAVSIEFAKAAKEHGYPVIAETSVAFSMSQPSRHSSGKRLLDYADVILDNQVPFGDMAFPVEGQKFMGLGPVSGIAGMYIVHAMLTQAVMVMVENGYEAPVNISGNLDTGEEHNMRLLEKYWDRLRNL
jgi:uncharacterized phosphosugar-binding protein